MKKILFLILCPLMLLVGASAQTATATVTPSASTYSGAGGQVTFTVALTFPTTAQASVNFSARPLSAAWVYQSTVSAQPQIITPVPFEIVTAGDPVNGYGWAYEDPAVLASGSASFTFVLSYPAGLTGPQTFAFGAEHRAGGVLTSMAIPNIVLTPAPPPAITTQASSQSVLAGGTATFAIAATGTPAPTYQWYFTATVGGTPVALTDLANKRAGSLSPTLTVSNVQPAEVGFYHCVATNIDGSTPGVAAQLSIADRVLRVAGLTATAGTPVTVSIQLLASGQENALGGTLNFDTGSLTYQSVVLGSAAADAQLLPTTSQTASGKLGFALAKPAGIAWAAGTHEVLKVTFLLNASAPNGTLTTIGFGSTPTVLEVSSVNAIALPTGYQPGNITASTGFEADMNGNGVVSITDWVKIGRIVAGLDPMPTGVDFMKADCAGRATLGNGVISITDWVQAGRYAAGLDPLTPVGGPSAP